MHPHRHLRPGLAADRATCPSTPAVLRPAFRCATCRTLTSVFDQDRSIIFCKDRTFAQSCSRAALKILCRSRLTLPSWACQSMAPQSGTPSGPFARRAAALTPAATGAAFTSVMPGLIQARPSHTGVEKLYPVIASNLPFGSGGSTSISVQRLTCPRQPRFQAQPPRLVSGQLSPGHPAEGPGTPPWASCRLSAAGVRFLGILLPPAGFRSPHGRPTRQRLDPGGVSTFRTSESRPGLGALFTPRPSGAHTAGPIPPAAARPLSQGPGPITPACIPSPGAVYYEASSRVHSRSPARPSPSPVGPWMEQDLLGLHLRASHPGRQDLRSARRSGGRASSTRPELYARHQHRTSFRQAHSQCATSCRTTGLDMTVFPHRRAARLLGQALAPSTRQSGKKATTASPGKRRPLAQRHPRRGRRRRRPLRHLPRRALPPPRQTREASARPWPPSPAPSSSSSSTCSPTPPPGTATSAPATTTTAPTTERKVRNHVRQLEALGLTVTITPAEDAA